MTTIQRFRASASGPVTFQGKLPAGTLMVRTQAGAQAEIVVSTDDNSGPSADAVRKTRFNESGGVVRVEVPMQNGGGNVVIGNNVIIGSGVTVVNGAVIGGGGSVRGISPIYIAALLPTNSNVDFEGVSTGVTVEGQVAHISGRSTSGSVRVERAASADVETVSGGIEIAALGGDARLRSVSGGIRAHALVPCQVQANAVSGNVTVSGARVRLDGRSVSGRVRQL